MKRLEENKYGIWYSNIIEYRINNPVDGYTERHHIIPRSLGGSNDDVNLVDLTPKEHFICHLLLAKYYNYESYEWYKMNHAFMMMKCNSQNQDRYFNSRLYQTLRENFSKVMSKSQSGKKNSNYGAMWISNVSKMVNKKIPKGDEIPDGWVKGRNVWNRIERPSPIEKTCEHCNCKFITTKKNGRFCSMKCKNAFKYVNAKRIDITRDGEIRQIKIQDFNAYSKCGWKKI